MEAGNHARGLSPASPPSDTPLAMRSRSILRQGQAPPDASYAIKRPIRLLDGQYRGVFAERMKYIFLFSILFSCVLCI